MPNITKHPPVPTLRLPQARILQALAPVTPSDPVEEWPILTRGAMAYRAGYTEKSGSITRALLGIREESSSGDPHLGLHQLGCVEVIQVNIDGVYETNYRITMQGVKALAQFYMLGGVLPQVKDAAAHTNQRYKESE